MHTLSIVRDKCYTVQLFHQKHWEIVRAMELMTSSYRANVKIRDDRGAVKSIQRFIYSSINRIVGDHLNAEIICVWWLDFRGNGFSHLYLTWVVCLAGKFCYSVQTVECVCIASKELLVTYQFFSCVQGYRVNSIHSVLAMTMSGLSVKK